MKPSKYEAVWANDAVETLVNLLPSPWNEPLNDPLKVPKDPEGPDEGKNYANVLILFYFIINITFPSYGWNIFILFYLFYYSTII